jgi:hypothetical protein
MFASRSHYVGKPLHVGIHKRFAVFDFRFGKREFKCGWIGEV